MLKLEWEGTIEEPPTDSLSNGCLMRVTPLAVWSHKLSPQNIYKVCRIDTKCTHGNLTAIKVVSTYCVGIAHLLNHWGDRKGALTAMKEFVETHGSTELKQWW